jgi:hypothetical protein
MLVSVRSFTHPMGCGNREMSDRILSRLWLLMPVLCGFFAATAQGQSYLVDCSGVLPNTYPSITSALQVAGPGSYVVIASPCNENVVISNASNLNVGAFYGSTVNINGSVSITASNSVFLYGLNVTNPLGDAYTVTSSHNVTLWTSTGNGNLGHGLLARGLSDVSVWGPAQFDNNGTEGIYLSDGSVVGFSTWGGPADISNNHGSGVWLSYGSVFSTLGNTTIESNVTYPGASPGQGFGIRILGASKVQIGTCFGPNQIAGNLGGGVDIEENSELSFWNCGAPYQSYITANGPVGISSGLGSQVTLYENAQISGHTQSGVELYGKSQLNVFGTNLISENGTSGDPRSAGIVVDGNSEAYLRGGQITSNEGPGILALVNSSADFAGATFSGNSGGVIVCDSSAYMVSDLLAPGRSAPGIVCRTPHNLGNRHSLGGNRPATPNETQQKQKAAQYEAAAKPRP